MSIYTRSTVLFLSLVMWTTACHQKTTPVENPAVWNKIHLNFKQLDADGLSGPTTGKVAKNYEFCIPAEDKYWQEVRKIDPTAQKQPAKAKGRIGCRDNQTLIIGSTHQARYTRVLYQLGSLSYVERIDETFWE